MDMGIASRAVEKVVTLTPAQNSAIMTIAIVAGGACFAWALFELVWRRSPLLLLCLAGSVLSNPIEVFWDVLGHLRHAGGTPEAFTMFADLAVPVRYPVWAFLIYMGFSGVACFVFYRMLEKAPTRRVFIATMIGQAVMNIVLEGYVITFAYDYYGYQPWRFFGDFPAWWVPANYGELLGAAMLLQAVRWYGKSAQWLAIVIVPGSFAAWEMWAGWPMYWALNADLGWLATNVAAFATAGIGIGTIWAIGRFMVPDWVGDNGKR
jgi:hypothetical protein